MKSYLGIEDDKLPNVSKQLLQQYDNYQIYDLVCSDINTQTTSETGTTTQSIKQTNFIAIQAYSPHAILCDFNSIVTSYP